jgi:lipid-binding SYLF domain-containing protein
VGWCRFNTFRSGCSLIAGGADSGTWCRWTDVDFVVGVVLGGVVVGVNLMGLVVILMVQNVSYMTHDDIPA